MVILKEADDPEQIYRYHKGIYAPYFYATDYPAWKKSFEEDVDGDGRTLFKDLFTDAAYDGNELC